MVTFVRFSLLPIVMTCLRFVLSSSYEKYLNNCASELYTLCGDEIFYTVFSSNQTTGTECCYNLVNEVGERCHEDLTIYIFCHRKITSPTTFQKN